MTKPAFRYCDEPLKVPARPIMPALVEVGLRPEVAGWFVVLSEYGRAPSLRCQISSCPGDHVEPLVE